MANMQKASSGYVIASSLAKVFFGPHYDVLKDFNFNDQKQLDAWWQATDRIGFGAPYSANLQGLSKSGGKVIMWNGVSDPCCIDTGTERLLPRRRKVSRRRRAAGQVRQIVFPAWYGALRRRHRSRGRSGPIARSNDQLGREGAAPRRSRGTSRRSHAQTVR